MDSKNKQRPNTKALKPHVHITIFAYNDFLCQPKRHIEREFCQLNLDFKIDQAPHPQDIAKALCYTVKSGKQNILRQATNTYMAIEPITVVINPGITNNYMRT